MTSSYITHAWRAIRHNWQYMLISMLGLVLSLAGAIIIARYVHQELTVDHYIPELDRTMVLYEPQSDGTKGHTDHTNHNNFENYPAPQNDIDVEAYTRFFAYDDAQIATNDRELVLATIVADSSFFDILPRKIVKGCRPKQLFQAIVAEDVAEKLWPGENPLGQTLSMHSEDNAYTVVGVASRPSTKGNFDFDVLLCRETEQYFSSRIGWMVCRLVPGASPDSINARTPHFEKTSSYGYKYESHPQMMPLADMYFDRSFGPGKESSMHISGNRHNIQILLIVAMILLLVGLFNFLNIYSIVMVVRSRGFAVRKAYGAKLSAIFAHIFTENFIVAAVAVAIAWAIVAVASPLLSRYYSIDQHPSPAFDALLTAGIAFGFPLAVSMGAAYGIWKKAHVHSMDNTEPHDAIALRRYCLLLPQMVLTIALITISVYFMRQMHYMLNADMGFETENIVAFRLWPNQGRRMAYTQVDKMTREEIMKQRQKEDETMAAAISKIRALPQVIAAAMWYPMDKPSLLKNAQASIMVQKAGNPENEWINALIVFMSQSQMYVFGIKLAEGISIADYEKDGANARYDYKAYPTRSLLNKLGIKDAFTEKLQTEKRLWYHLEMDCSANPPYETLGVIDHLRMAALSEEDTPVMIFPESDYDNGKPIIRYRHEAKEKLLAELTKIYQEINGEDAVPEFEFSEDVTAEVYAKDKRAARIYATFAMIAVFISCLGLYGVVAYDMQRRQREFTIRRVQGASRSDILRLVFKPYSATIAIAAAIAAPIAVYAIVRYQSHYSDHAAMLPWGFIGGVAAIALVAYATIMLQVKAIFKKKSLIS